MPINLKKKPFNHVAIIMDGNGRWAQSRSHSRVWGHIRGVRTVSQIIEEADDYGVEALTLYAFSTENWSRPLGEVKTLFSLLKKFLKKEKERINKLSTEPGGFPQVAKNGIWGDPTKATKKDGEKFLAEIVRNLAKECQT